MKRLTSALVTVLTGVALLAAMPSTAAAHERREVGNYVVVVGFLVEPAFVEHQNAALITVFKKDGTPVEGVEKTLKVEVTTGGQSRTFDLKRQPGKPSDYLAEFIPTRTGSYTFRFFGTIESQPFNETFQSGPNRFDEVVSAEGIQFPVKVPSNGDLAAQLPAGGGSSSAPAPAAGGVGGADVQRALDRADSARALAIGFGLAGLAAGLAGLAVAALAMRRRGGGSPAPPGGSGRAEPV